MSTAREDVEGVETIIARLPSASQRRVHVIAEILRDLLTAGENEDEMREASLAFTLVLAELAALI